MSKIAIINVGANAASGSLRSPLFNDNTFEFVPTKTDNELPPLGFTPFSEFESFNGRDITEFIPHKFSSENMHNDPEFVTHTYGDTPEDEIRSVNLKRFNKGDTLYYLARLVEWNNGTWGKAGFYLVGCLVLDKIIKKSDMIENPELIQVVKNNAHVKRWQEKPEAEPRDFWVLVGSNQSKRFVHAVPFDREILNKILSRADGNPIKWDSSKTDLQTIGMNTRTCRLIIDSKRQKILEEHVKKYC